MRQSTPTIKKSQAKKKENEFKVREKNKVMTTNEKSKMEKWDK